MVICENLIDGTGITDSADCGLNLMLGGIKTFYNARQSDLNFYVAFRAVDKALDKTNLKKIYNEIIRVPAICANFGSDKIIRLSNALYSYFICCMSQNMRQGDNDIYNINNVVHEDNYNFSSINIIGELQKLRVHAGSALSICNNHMPGIINNRTSYLSSHVYYTATPIDEEARVYDNTSKKDSVAEFSGFSEGLSLCFGSMQLCIDILKRHNRFAYEDDDTYSIILDSIIK